MADPQPVKVRRKLRNRYLEHAAPEPSGFHPPVGEEAYSEARDGEHDDRHPGTLETSWRPTTLDALPCCAIGGAEIGMYGC